MEERQREVRSLEDRLRGLHRPREPRRAHPAAIDLLEAGAPPGLPEPAPDVVARDRRGDGDVEAFDEAAHRDPKVAVRTRDRPWAEPEELIAEHQRELLVDRD